MVAIAQPVIMVSPPFIVITLVPTVWEPRAWAK